MPNPSSQLSAEGKLDALCGAVQRIIETANASDAKGSRDLAEINHRLSRIEEILDSLASTARALLDRSAGGWSERP